MSAAPLEKCVDETPVHSAPGVIPRPGFQNRRNRSQYLKNLYPAGFAVNNVRRELLVDQFPNRVGSPSQIHTGQPISFSFTGWARGGMEDSSSLGSMSFLEGDGDPFADCAGPTLRELTAMKSSGIKKSMDFYPEESSCLVSRCTLYSSAANRPKRLALPPKSPVYHAPAYLPSLNPIASNTRAPAAYERWLQQRRNNANEKAWYIKGNNEKANYSPHVFNGDQPVQDPSLLAALNLHSSSSSALHPSVVPMGLPDSIAVEIHTTNQVRRARSTADEGAHYAYKILSKDASLRQVKTTIVQDIVRSIQHAFAAEAIADASSVASVMSNNHPASLDGVHQEFSQDSIGQRSYDSMAMNSLLSSNSRVSVSVNQLDLVLHYFHPGLQAWKALEEEQDWVQAKYLYAQQSASFVMDDSIVHSVEGDSAIMPPPLQLMYALEPKSEQQLLKEIEAHYEQRRQQLQQVKEHISIAALTEALQGGANHAAHRSWISTVSSSGDSVAGSSSTPQRLPPFSSQSKRSSHSSSKSLLSAGPSILYPKPNAKLKSLAEQGAASNERLQAVAKNLEQQILRTKW